MSDISPVEDYETGTLEDGGTGALEDGVIGGLEDEEELYGKEYLRVEETGPGPGQESHGLWIVYILQTRCSRGCSRNTSVTC